MGFRRAITDPFSAEDQALLLTITHPDLDAPVYLSTDPTDRLSVDPPSYGTVSGDITYLYVQMTAVLPDDNPKTPRRTSLEFGNVDASYVALARSFLTPARVDMALVFVSDPNAVMKRFARMWLTRASGTDTTIAFDIGRFRADNIPAGRRITVQECPGLRGSSSS
ncbi:hypothetical protein [Methylosinus trichosporium]|uniref:hypothetical protein n=1 Tax=Methylosinus trichosporium TaxID=426 RepID=UPI0002EFF8E8|nr:hypothetical protein [Methylosinus trichosporium]